MLRCILLLVIVAVTGCYYPQNLQTCSDNTDCLNNGICIEGVCECEFQTFTCNTTNADIVLQADSCQCVCYNGYEGVNCDTEERADFIGTYNVTEVCSSGNYAYSITVTTSGAGISSIIVTNFGDYNINLSGTVSGDNVTFASQTIGGGTFSGVGRIYGNILTITYNVTSGTASDNCTMTCTKQ